MTYTFTMKDGLTWSDGTPLTAADVEYSWQRLADPDTGADYAYLADVIAKNDDGTLQVEASEDGTTFTVSAGRSLPVLPGPVRIPGLLSRSSGCRRRR